MAQAGVGSSAFFFPARRLFSLSGIGVACLFFLILKTQGLWLKGTALNDPALSHAFLSLPWLSALAVLLLYHAGMGLTILARGRVNVWRYPFAANWRYTLARITGVIGVGILIAVAGFLFWQHHMLPMPMEPGKLLPLPWAVAWLAGSTALIWYLCNGAAQTLLSWGVTVSRASRKFVRVVVSIAFVVGVIGNSLLQSSFVVEALLRPDWLRLILERLIVGG